LFYAFADEEAGEVGSVYQACTWLYIGRATQRERRVFTGDMQRAYRSTKHRYVWTPLPSLRRRLIDKFGFTPYPKRPELDEHASQYDAGRASRDAEVKTMAQEIATLTAKLNGYVLKGDRHRTPHVLKDDGTWTKAKGRVTREHYTQKTPPKVCENCGHLFVARAGARTCSAKCRKALQRLKSQSGQSTP
jgi:hypothetical protein